MQQCPECRTINRIGEKFCGECRCPLPANTCIEYPFPRIAGGPPSNPDIDLFFDINQFLMVDSVFTQRLYIQALGGNLSDFFLCLMLKDSDKKSITRSGWEPEAGNKRILRVNFKASEPGIPTFSLYVGYRRNGLEQVWKAEFEQPIVREYTEPSQFVRDLHVTFSDNIRMGRADNIDMNRDLKSLQTVLGEIKPGASINEVMNQVRNAKPQWCRLRLEITRWRPAPDQWPVTAGSSPAAEMVSDTGTWNAVVSEPAAKAENTPLRELFVQPVRGPSTQPFLESITEQLMETAASVGLDSAAAMTLDTGAFRVHLTTEPVVGIGRNRKNRIVARLYNSKGQATEKLNGAISRHQASIEMDEKGFRLCPQVADRTDKTLKGCHLDGGQMPVHDPVMIRRSTLLTFPLAAPGLPGVFGFRLEPWFNPETTPANPATRDGEAPVPDALVLKRLDNIPEVFVIIRTCFNAGVLHDSLKGLMVSNENGRLIRRTQAGEEPVCTGTEIVPGRNGHPGTNRIGVSAWRQYFCSSDPVDFPDRDREPPWMEHKP